MVEDFSALPPVPLSQVAFSNWCSSWIEFDARPINFMTYFGAALMVFDASQDEFDQVQ